MAGCAGAVQEVARERGCVREVAGKSACSEGSGRGVCAGVLHVVCVLHRLPFCVGTGYWGVLGCWGVLVCWGVLGCAGVSRSCFFLRLRLLRMRSSGLRLRPFPPTRTHQTFGNGR